MYVPGKMTVMLNTSGVHLNLGMKNRAGRPVSMHPKKGLKYIDVEEVFDEDTIKAYGYELEEWTRTGKITWHPKGSKPAPGTQPKMRLPQAAGETVTAPPNVYDAKINEQIAKERLEDEKSKASSTERDLTRATESVPENAAPTTISSSVPPQTRYADVSQGEIDAGAGTGPPGTRAADSSQAEIDAAQVIVPPADPGASDLTRETSPYDSMPIGELVDAAAEIGIIERKGTYWAFEGETVGNGKKGTCEALEQNAELLAKIRAAMSSSTGG